MKAKGVRNVGLESDRFLSKRWLQDHRNTLTYLFFIYILLYSIVSCSLVFKPRTSNQLAHALITTMGTKIKYIIIWESNNHEKYYLASTSNFYSLINLKCKQLNSQDENISSILTTQKSIIWVKFESPRELNHLITFISFKWYSKKEKKNMRHRSYKLRRRE